MKTLADTFQTAPRRLWALREFQCLEGTRDARRAAGYLCQFTRADYKRPIGVFSNCIHLRDRLSLGLAFFQTSPRQTCVQGPPSSSLLSGYSHSSLIGVSEDSAFRDYGGYWVLVLVSGAHVSTTIHWKGDSVPLGMAINLISLLWASSPLLSPSLASGPSSLRSRYEAWKAGTLSRSSLADIAPPDAIAAYFSESPGLPSSRSTLRSLLKVFFGSSPCKFSEGPTGSCYFEPVPLSGRRTCALAHPVVRRSPWSFLRPRGDVSSAVTGAPPGSLSARCVVFTVSLC